MNERILVAEDDPAILTGVADLLESEGYRVDRAENGTAALELYRADPPDLVLLDVMMPGMNGYDLCRAIRRENRVVPVVMLTAKGQEVDKVLGLELGADDYIVKPFGMAELLARVRSALRRAALASEIPPAETTIFSFGKVRVDFASMSGLRGTVPFELTPREAELLHYLLARPNRVVSRDTLLEELWGVDCEITTRTVDQHMARLRQKVEEDPAHPRWLQTVHGAGYRFTGCFQ